MFWLSLWATVMLGMTSALGELTVLGFLKNFPPETVGYFTSGTGFAAVCGSGSLIII